MTDTSTTGTTDTGPAADTGIPAEGQIAPEHAAAAEHQQPDPGSEEQLQREAVQNEQEAEAERLAALDMETEADKAGTPLDTGVWGSTGHAAADGAMRTLQNAGLSTDDAMGLLYEAAVARDPGKVDQKALTAKIGPRRAKAIMESLEAFSRDMRPKDERLANDVYQHTNGPHGMHRLMEQAGAMLSPTEVQGYIIQIGKGGSSARRAIESLQAMVAGEVLPLDRRVHVEQYGTAKPAPPPKASAGLTSKDYVAALEALHASGSRLSFEARDRREAELHEARRIGRENGLS